MVGPALTGAEALMWALDDEPALRSTFVSVSVLDRPADLDWLRAKLAHAALEFPVLRQRVVAPPFGLAPPYWEDDPEFDVARHVRAETVTPATVASGEVARPATLADVLALAATRGAEPFDAAHPLWELIVVNGLEGGKGALVAKLHHVLSDGVTAVRMSAAFLDAAPDVPPPSPTTAGPAGGGGPSGGGGRSVEETAVEVAASVAAGAEELWKAVGGVAQLVTRAARDPGGAVEQAWQAALAITRQAAMLDAARSPLWTARSYRHQFEVTALPLGDVQAVGKALGGTVNDVFVTIVAAAAGAYHRRRGAPVDELRVSVPVSTRGDAGGGRNAWAPARVLVPTGDLRPAERLAEVHRRLAAVKSDPSLGLVDLVAGSARLLPRSLLVPLALRGVRTVDFASSNVRGAPFDLWVAGAHVEANYPFGPTAGVAFNATVLSYRGSLDLGLNADTGAVDDPGALRACITEAAEEVLAVSRRPPPRAAGGPATAGQLGGNA